MLASVRLRNIVSEFFLVFFSIFVIIFSLQNIIFFKRTKRNEKYSIIKNETFENSKFGFQFEPCDFQKYLKIIHKVKRA